MKIGLRKPSLKKSIKARTTGKLKRSIKKKVNPLYGKKGMGYINDPKKAIYNKVYNKTTVGVGDVARTVTNSNKTHNKKHSKTTYKFFGNLIITLAILFILIGVIGFAVGGIIFIIPGIFLFMLGRKKLKLSNIVDI